MNAARILIRRSLFSSRMGHLSGPVRSFSLHKLASPLKITKTRPLILHLVRNYSAASSLSTEDIQNRIIDILKSFEKVDQSKVTVASHFTDDLGLDSLDAVEVVMAIEEEFSIEIPDKDADEIKTVQQAIDYVSKCEEAS